MYRTDGRKKRRGKRRGKYDRYLAYPVPKIQSLDRLNRTVLFNARMHFLQVKSLPDLLFQGAAPSTSCDAREFLAYSSSHDRPTTSLPETYKVHNDGMGPFVDYTDKDSDWAGLG